MEILGIKVDAIVRLIREVVVTIFIGLVVYKMIDVDLAFDFTKLSATDLVALILAIFSVGLSAAFYFAATGSSAKFYDNMHKFTKDTSVILGQLTERLDSVDKGQSEVKSRFDQLYSGNNDAEIKEKAKQKEDSVNKSRDDLKSTVDEWFKKLPIGQVEKDDFKRQLEEKERQLSTSLEQLSEFKSAQKSNLMDRVKNHTRMQFRKLLKQENVPFEIIMEKILERPSQSTYMNDLSDLGFIDNPSASSIKDVTDEGFMFFSNIYENLI